MKGGCASGALGRVGVIDLFIPARPTTTATREKMVEKHLSRFKSVMKRFVQLTIYKKKKNRDTRSAADAVECHDRK